MVLRNWPYMTEFRVCTVAYKLAPSVVVMGYLSDIHTFLPSSTLFAYLAKTQAFKGRRSTAVCASTSGYYIKFFQRPLHIYSYLASRFRIGIHYFRCGKYYYKFSNIFWCSKWSFLRSTHWYGKSQSLNHTMTFHSTKKLLHYYISISIFCPNGGAPYVANEYCYHTIRTPCLCII